MPSSAEAERGRGATAGPVDAAAPRCETCGNGRLARDRIKTALWSGGRLVVVEDVPAFVCRQCGEQFYEDETAMRLDMLKGGGFPSAEAARELIVPVFIFETPRRGDGGGSDER